MSSYLVVLKVTLILFASIENVILIQFEVLGSKTFWICTKVMKDNVEKKMI